MRARGARGASASTRRSAAAPARPRRRAAARGLGAADGVGDAALGPQVRPAAGADARAPRLQTPTDPRPADHINQLRPD